MLCICQLKKDLTGWRGWSFVSMQGGGIGEAWAVDLDPV